MKFNNLVITLMENLTNEKSYQKVKKITFQIGLFNVFFALSFYFYFYFSRKIMEIDIATLIYVLFAVVLGVVLSFVINKIVLDLFEVNHMLYKTKSENKNINNLIDIKKSSERFSILFEENYYSLVLLFYVIGFSIHYLI